MALGGNVAKSGVHRVAKALIRTHIQFLHSLKEVAFEFPRGAIQLVCHLDSYIKYMSEMT